MLSLFFCCKVCLEGNGRKKNQTFHCFSNWLKFNPKKEAKFVIENVPSFIMPGSRSHQLNEDVEKFSRWSGFDLDSFFISEIKKVFANTTRLGYFICLETTRTEDPKDPLTKIYCEKCGFAFLLSLWSSCCSKQDKRNYFGLSLISFIINNLFSPDSFLSTVKSKTVLITLTYPQNNYKNRMKFLLIYIIACKNDFEPKKATGNYFFWWLGNSKSISDRFFWLFNTTLEFLCNHKSNKIAWKHFFCNILLFGKYY